MRNMPEYHVWEAMISRCYRPNNKDFVNYGGRGISVCDEWRADFSAFISDLGRRPSNTHSLDRIDNNKGYSKDNCKWSTRNEQNRNKRSNIMIEYNGNTLCLSDYCKQTGLSLGTVKYRRFVLKWPLNDAIFIGDGRRNKSSKLGRSI